MSTNEGPFVQAACFCENVLQEKSGVFSLIRIIDTVTQTATGSTPPEDMPPLTYQMKMVIMLKSGRARGRGDIIIKIEEPSGIKTDGPAVSAHFEGGNKGHNIITNINYTFSQEGVYWFWIFLDEELLTGVPFQVKYSRITTT